MAQPPMGGRCGFFRAQVRLFSLGFLVLFLMALVRVNVEHDCAEDLFGVVGQRQLGHFTAGRSRLCCECRPFSQNGSHVIADKGGDVHAAFAF